MNVDLKFTTKTTEKGKVKVIRNLTMKKAREIFKSNKEEMTSAYITHFDGWHRNIVERLKEV